MSRRLRFIPPGSLVEVTCRTVQGLLLLRPSPLLNEITLGVLGRAQRLYEVEIHAFVFLSNHYHLLLTARDSLQLARFMGFVNSNLAREAGRMHHWRDKFWGRRYEAIVVSHEDAAQVERLHYLLCQGCKERLVSSPTEWPGVHSTTALLRNEPLQGRWFDRTAEYEARRSGKEPGPCDFATQETVKLIPLPCWKDLSRALRSQRVAELVRSIEVETAAVLSEARKQPLGPAHIQLQHPHTRPQHCKKSPAPLIHAGSKVVRRAFREAYRGFVAAYREASRKLRSGILDAPFPAGSFPPALSWVGGLAPS